ncbi:MID1 [Blepharisma stoltei]|uniref:Uncharacterized protein n=1 Tax=Blepharisma stoltei TaxID=1481888 RepID=A0AAU9IPT2_9CILI|nr:unnamed protein product [Blepharisma stoltei]
MLRIDKECMCPVCLDILRDPIILSCSHNLCYECASQLITVISLREKDSKVFSCPICRGCTFLTSLSPECLPKNIVLKNIIENWKTAQEPSSHILCQLCVENPKYATSECITCESTLCQDCSVSHLSKSRFAHHKILHLSKVKQELCMEHHLEEDLFCMTDCVKCCMKCAQFSSLHNGHTILTREDAKARLAAEIIQTKETLPQIYQRITLTKDEIKRQFEELVEQQQKNTNELDEVCNQLNTKVEAIRSSTKSKICKSYETLKQNLIEKVVTLDGVQKQAQELSNLTDDLSLYQKAKELSTIDPQLIIGEKPEVILQFKNQSALNNLLESLCTLELKTSEIVESNKLYYLSRGSKEYVRYDLESQRTSTMSIRSAEIIPRWSGFVLLPNGNILITGGKPSKESGAKLTAFYLNPETGETTPAPSMINGHSSHICLLINNEVYVLSGKNEINQTLNHCEVLNLATQNWRSIASMAYGRTCASGVHIKNCIYVFGGYQTTVNNTIERYSIESNNWQLLPTILPDKLWQHGCYALDSSQILIFGGEGPSDEPHRMSYVYNTITDEFYNSANIPLTSTWLFFWLHVTRKGHMLYSINKENYVLKYNIVTNTWIPLAN